MTKKVVVANLSNWAGEDYEIFVKDKCVTLRPGECCVVTTGQSVDVRVKEKEQEVVEPFYVNDLEQTWPELSIQWISKRAVHPKPMERVES